MILLEYKHYGEKSLEKNKQNLTNACPIKWVYSWAKVGFSRSEKPKINCSGAARSNLEILHSDFCCVLQQIILYTACGHLTCAALSFIVLFGFNWIQQDTSMCYMSYHDWFPNSRQHKSSIKVKFTELIICLNLKCLLQWPWTTQMPTTVQHSALL